ncbi:MAG: hypothetical protein ACUVV4_00405 [Candidatus Bathyarchaeia archaeon]
MGIYPRYGVHGYVTTLLRTAWLTLMPLIYRISTLDTITVVILFYMFLELFQALTVSSRSRRDTRLLVAMSLIVLI